MAQLRLTKTVIDRLEHPTAGQVLYYDTALRGFGVRIGRDSKSYFAEKRLNGRSVCITIGRHGIFTLEQARAAAHEHLHSLATGTNPIEQRAERETAAVSLRAVFAEFKLARKALKLRTLLAYERCLEMAFPDWMDRPLAAITRDMVQKRHSLLGERNGQAYANLCMRVLNSVFNFAISRYEAAGGTSLIRDNPVQRLSQTRAWYRIERRRSFIRPHQLAAWMAAVMSLKATRQAPYREVMRDYLLVLLFTGLRREEAAQLRWTDIDLHECSLVILQRASIFRRIRLKPFRESAKIAAR